MASLVASTLIQPGDIDTVRANVHGDPADPTASIRIGATGDTVIQTGSETGPDDLIALLETALDRLTRTYAAWVDEQESDEIVRGGTGPASPAPPTAKTSAGAEDDVPGGEDGTGRRDPATAAPRTSLPGPARQTLINLIQGEWIASCLAQDDREVGDVGADVVLDPENRAIVGAALIESVREGDR